MSTQVPVPTDIEAKMEASLAEIEKEVTGKDLSAAPATEPPSEPAKEVAQTEAQPAEPTSAEPSPSTPTYSKDYQDLLSKYGGDVNKAAQAFWETNNRAAALAKENEELKAKVTAPPAETVKTPEPEPVVPEDVKRFDDKLRAIEDENKVLQQDYDKVQDAKDAAKKEINRLIDEVAGGQLELDADVAARKALKAKRAEYDYWLREERGIELEHKRLKELFDNTKTLKNITERTLALSSAREAEIRDSQVRGEETALLDFGRAFLDAIPTVAKEGDAIPKDSLEDFAKYAKQQSYLKWATAAELNPAEIPAFLAETKAEFLSTLDRFHRAKSAVYAAKKAADATVSAPDGKAAVAGAVKTTGFKSQQEVERFMEHASQAL